MLDLADVLAQLPDAVLVADAAMRVVHANDAAAKLFGTTIDELVASDLPQLMPERMRSAHVAGFQRFLATRSPTLVGGPPVRVPALRHDGTEVDVDLSLGATIDSSGTLLFVGTLRDVTDVLALERRIAASSYLEAALVVAAALQRAESTEEALANVLPSLCERLDWSVAGLWVVDGDALACAHFWRVDPVPAVDFERQSRERRFVRGEGLPGRCWAAESPVFLADLPTQEQFPRLTAAKASGLRSGLAFPLLDSHGVRGVIELFATDDRIANEELLDLLGAIGRQLGQFLERMDTQEELRHSEARYRELAETLQRSLLPPHLPAVPGVELAAHYRAGGAGVQVGGDFYDVFATNPDTWWVVIGDVCGKGAPAAAVTALARHTIRAAALHTPGTDDVLRLLNAALLRGDDEQSFITTALLRLDISSTGIEVEITQAGHPAPLLLRRGEVRGVGSPGTLLGILDEINLTPERHTLDVGDLLVLYTDGVTEARDETGQELAESGLAAVLAGVPVGSAQDAVDAVLHATLAHRTGRSRDDLALLVLRVTGAR